MHKHSPTMANNCKNNSNNPWKDIDSDSSMSFGGGTCSRRSSFSSTSSSSMSGPGRRKPHKANHAAWEAMRRLHHQAAPHGYPGTSATTSTGDGAAGRVGLDHFRLLRRLGSGDLGNVYLCQIRNPIVGLPQCFYAMKVVDREALAIRKKLQRAEMEKEILGMLDHPFLPTLYAEFEASHYSCWVMEFCPGGDLYSARQKQPGKRFSISSAKFYAAETILALEYLHMMGIVYRDLKPENVLVREDGHIMLSDFDLSLKCDVVPKLLRRAKELNRSVSTNDTRSVRNDTPSCVSVGPIKPVLSCFLAANRRMRKRTAVTTITTTITEHADPNAHSHEVVEEKELEEEEVTPMDGPELVAEPINARSRSFVGTHEYLAPEVISGQGHGSAVDWWTLGVFLYEMLYGRTPFKGENNEKTLVNILKQPLTFPRTVVSCPKDFEEVVKVQDLIRKLLVKNPKKRIGSVKGSVEIKRHEFFKGVNWALIRSVKPPQVPRDLVNTRNNNINGVNLRRSTPNYVPKFTKKEREEPYQIPHHVDYF